MSAFTFNSANQKKIKDIFKRYPTSHKRSALLPLLHLAQSQNGGWISESVIETIATLVGIAPMRVKEVVSFYTMFQEKPVGKYLIQVCRTTSCWLCGSVGVTQACQDFLGLRLGETTEDGLFTLIEVECLGACANAPAVQINDVYIEDVDGESFKKILGHLKSGGKLAGQSLKGRANSKAGSD